VHELRTDASAISVAQLFNDVCQRAAVGVL